MLKDLKVYGVCFVLKSNCFFRQSSCRHPMHFAESMLPPRIFTEYLQFIKYIFLHTCQEQSKHIKHARLIPDRSFADNFLRIRFTVYSVQGSPPISYILNESWTQATPFYVAAGGCKSPFHPSTFPDFLYYATI